MKTIWLKQQCVVATVLCFGIAMTPATSLLFAKEGVLNHAVLTPAVKSETQVRNEAALYDTSIREITRVTTMKLDTVDDLKAANEIVKKQAPNLKFRRSKLLAIGLSDSGFLNAAKERTRDSKSVNAFAEELVKDSQAIFKLTGASALGDRMARSVDADSATLQRVSEQLKKASEALKQKLKGHHSVGIAHATNSTVAVLSLTADQKAILVIGVVVVFFSPLLPVVVSVGATLAVGFVVVRLITNLVTGESGDDCVKQAQSECDQCVAAADALLFGLSIPAEAYCYAELILKLLACPTLWK